MKKQEQCVTRTLQCNCVELGKLLNDLVLSEDMNDLRTYTRYAPNTVEKFLKGF